ncbi:peroxisomal biogenesis factor 19 [Nematostella vectensis]|nr:peroxisomal biogenesis factor 19 [Nematostella vectensis]
MADEVAKSTEPVKDDDLDDLLESALEDFDKAAKPTPKSANQSQSSIAPDPRLLPPPVKTSGEPTPLSSTNDDQEEMGKLFAQSFAEAAADLEKAMKTMGGKGDEDFLAHLNNLAQSAASAASTENPDSMKSFESNLSQTLSDLAQNTKDMENMDPMGEDFLKALTGMSLDDEDGDLDMMPLMQGMMKNLLSKEILYPSLKELNEKYPPWLENKKSSHSDEVHVRFTKQHEYVNMICQEFEAEKPDDSEDIKKKRFQKIMSLMQQMQECGQPPEELVGQMAPGMPFGTEPSIGDMPELPKDLQECKVS